MIKEAIVKIVNKEDLSYQEAYAVMNEIMSGETTPTQNAAFLAALSTKSARAETTDEIAGCAAAMRDHATKVETGMEVFEIVGTGGDNAHSFNISTTSALVAAAGGMKVAKHGNRAASSLCGTADCLEALGVNIQLSPQQCVRLLQEVGICFFFAQRYHTSMKYVGSIRKELGFRTVFNILGPADQSGQPVLQLLGVYDEYLVEPLAQVLINLGVRRGMVVYGQEKLDEISMSAPTTVCEFKDGWFTTYTSPQSSLASSGAGRRICWGHAGGQRQHHPLHPGRGEAGMPEECGADERGGVPVHRRQGPHLPGGRGAGGGADRFREGPGRAGAADHGEQSGGGMR